MSLESLLWDETRVHGDQDWSRMSSNEIASLTGHKPKYVAKVRQNISRKKVWIARRKAKEINDWAHGTAEVIGMLEAIEQGLADWKRQQK
jgi:hypothetical protein